jgi:phosphoserine phosphatase RsbU/P
MSVSHGHQFAQLVSTTSLPLLVILGVSIVALLTRREVVYRYEDLAPHVRRIVERERVKAEIDAANRIQAALLPVSSPQLNGASVASHYRAATEIGGDYFDFLPQPDGDIGIAFGDVSGHGLTSGIVMAMAKAALLVQINVDSTPRVVLNVLNDIVMKTAPRRILMTFFFGLLNSQEHRLRFSSAGHLDPYVYRARGHGLESLSSWGFPLGVRRREPFREHVVNFTAGDRLILYSDGLIEAVDDDGEPFGFERFERTLLDCGHLSAEDIKKTLLGSIRKFTRNRPPEDDQTLVVVSFEEAVAEEEPAAVAYAAMT